MKLKVICLNVYIGGTLWENMSSFLRDQSADIVLLQEVYHTTNPEIFEKNLRTFTALSDELDYPYAHFSPAFIEKIGNNQIEQGQAIFSQLPLQPFNTVFYDVPYGQRVNTLKEFPNTPRSLQHLALELDEEQLHIFNTQGIWGRDGDDSPRRLAMAQTILVEIDKLPPTAPVLLAGDFNVKESTQTIAMIESKLKNVFEHTLQTTFNMRQKNHPGYATAVVDMMFVSHNVQVESYVCPNVDISDHLPLVATINI
jgi:endonuclease/exonuclease/phosphatase family metal-dependent hydrolase